MLGELIDHCSLHLRRDNHTVATEKREVLADDIGDERLSIYVRIIEVAQMLLENHIQRIWLADFFSLGFDHATVTSDRIDGGLS